MFDIAPDDIAQLNDVDLRELVGRLCEAELKSRGLSTVAVTWGGHQTAADGGLDVRVSLPSGTPIDGHIPRCATGFQVKIPDMPRKAILDEMRPSGVIRPIIQELADEAGAYIIVSSHGSTADVALRNRRIALREALADVASADQLHTDFYDRTRLATWVRQHPGLVIWVKEKTGRALVGWKPYAPWSGPAEGVDAEYLVDDSLRVHLGEKSGAPAESVADAIDELRDAFALSGKSVRLVGLSGVGKTRFVQALFDARIGSRPLAPSLAVYTNLSDNPNPQPVGMASDLMANRTRAILIVDNCPSDLHRSLTDLCTTPNSTLSVLTVEYDVRDDQPEGTQVVTLDTSSPELIEKLIRRRFSHLSAVDARTIADASGGNARIAVALAGTVEQTETLGGLSDDELFQRLFRQRHGHDDALLRAAQACSLVYSFQGEALIGDDAELPRLAELANHSVQEFYRYVAELLRRDLIQRRSVWRAVLPHAIANRLAAKALEDTPYDLIDQQLVGGGTPRLARSFSRRLSFLHDHPRAVAIVRSWLAPNGFLGNLISLNDLGQAMFENVAPVSPENTLAALERACSDPEATATIASRHRSLLRSLAYDPLLFERSIALLTRAATLSTDERGAKEAADTFASLFTVYLSGTHATIEQRLIVIEALLRSGEPKRRNLGLTGLDRVLEASHFSSGYRFEFGAWPRDFGYSPKTTDEIVSWYSAALAFIERLAITESVLKPELGDLLARNFRGLWRAGIGLDTLEAMFRRFAASGFWRAGWAACRQTLAFDKKVLAPEVLERLECLEAELRPGTLNERVRAMVLGDRSGGLDLEVELDGDFENQFERLEAIAWSLGEAVAADETALAELLPDLSHGGIRVWSFGRGLANASENRRAIWASLVNGVARTPPEQRNVQILRGFSAELWEQNRDLAQDFLDAALDDSVLAPFIPVLQSAAELDARGIERLKQAINLHLAPIGMFSHLAFDRATDQVSGRDLKDLLVLIAEQPDGFDVALQILSMRLYTDRAAQRQHEPEMVEAGRELLRRLEFKKGRHREGYNLARVVRTCLNGSEGAAIAAQGARRLKRAISTYEAHAFENDEILKALLSVQPIAVLDALFEGDDQEQRSGLGVFDYLVDHRANPADEISCEDLVSWCDQEPKRRFQIAASFVTFARREKEDRTLVWSEQAQAILAHAPDPKSVLAVFVDRFRPTSWSGSRAARIEANARLLDGLPSDLSMVLADFIAQAKKQLTEDIAREREWETDRDRERHERFE